MDNVNKMYTNGQKVDRKGKKWKNKWTQWTKVTRCAQII